MQLLFFELNNKNIKNIIYCCIQAVLIHTFIHTYITYSHYYRRGWNQLSLQLQDKYFGDTKSRQIFYSAIHCPE